MTDDLSSLLQKYNSATLLAIANYHGLSPKTSKTKATHVKRLADYFPDRKRILRVLKELSPAEREVVDTLLRNDGQATRHRIQRALFARKLIVRPPANERRYYRQQPTYRKKNSRRMDEVMARLLTLGLVFALRQPDAYGATGKKIDFNLMREYFIPEVIRRHLPEPPPAPPPPSLTTTTVTRTEEGSARTFQRDVFLYWSFVGANEVNLTTKEQLYKRSLTALNETLLVRETIGKGQTEADFRRLVFLRAMLSSLRLVRVKRGRTLTATPDPPFFALKPAERIKRCFETYVTGDIVNELAWYPKVRRDSQSLPFLPTPPLVADARRAVLLYFKSAAGWVSIQALLDRMREMDYEFLFERDVKPSHYAASYYYYGVTHPYTAYTNPLRWGFDGVKDEASGWDRVEAAFIRDILTGPLFWMGLVDLGYSGKKQAAPDAFRLTPVGAWLLGAGPEPEIRVEGGRVILQPNFHITAFDPVSDAVLMNLERFAERLSAERAAEFQLTRASVYAAQKQGWGADRIRAYLEEQTGAPLPANVSRTLDEWQAQHERITIRPNVSLIHAAAPEDLDALAADPALEPFLAARPAPTLVRLPGRKAIPKVVTLLLERERLPLVTSKPGQLPPRSVVVETDGPTGSPTGSPAPRAGLRFTVPTPDLYLHGHLARFADPDGNGYRLNPKSVRRAANSGLTAPQILESLAQVLRDPLPEDLELRVRAWAGHYGDAALEEVILLQLKDQATLKELQQDPEVGPLLQPFKPPRTRALARVRPRNLKRLRTLLEERGIALKDRLR